MKTLILVAALWSVAPMADESRPRTVEEVEKIFDSLDRNHDDRISKEEAARQESLRERFAGVDSSGDGFLSRSEFRARPSDEPFE